jgi:hypothetical protein
MAELVVLGTTAERRIEVEELLFGKPVWEMDGRRVVPLGASPGVPPGRTGVWFLVRGPDGYAPINPDGAALSPEAFRDLPKQAEHWIDEAGLVPNRPSDCQFYYSCTMPGTEHIVWHGTDVYRNPDGDLRVVLNLHGQRESLLVLDRAGSVQTIVKSPAVGHGFYMDYCKGRIREFCHFKDRKRHGLARRYYRENLTQILEEKHFTDGVIDGRSRQWDERGQILRDETYELGFLPPVIRYTGKESSGVVLHRSEEGVSYSTAPVVSQVRIGMTVQEVSDLLKVDFSPFQGLMFHFFRADEFLFVGFKDGRVSELRTGPNGVTPGPRRRG